MHIQIQIQIDPPKPVIAPNGVPIYRIERGGEVTYHGPGMLVVYPLLDLRRDPYKQDLHWYLRCVEEVIIQVLKEFNITGVRDDINTGMVTFQNRKSNILKVHVPYEYGTWYV